MTYARSRLYLGISSVGTLVLLSCLVLGMLQFDMAPFGSLSLSTEPSFLTTYGQVYVVFGVVFLLMMPFDFLGGYWLPTLYHRSDIRFQTWLKKYIWSVTWQLFLYATLGTCLIFSYRAMGTGGVMLLGSSSMTMAIWLRNFRFSNPAQLSQAELDNLSAVEEMLDEIKLGEHEIVIVDRQDQGFTGGIIGAPSREKIIVPKSWLSFKPSVLKTILARRILAIRSGDYIRGLFGAFAWNLTGLMLATGLANSGLSNVFGLVEVICWFTLFSFVGLLFMPTFSRVASIRLDRMLMVIGVNKSLVKEAARAMDRLQDDEPVRPDLIETIFHPIPSVESRTRKVDHSTYGTWQIARTTLVTSWGCLGLLARAVHCNVGRPDLWLLPPSD